MLVVAWGSARSAPWAKVSFETLSRGLEGRPHDRALLGSFCAKRPSADKAYNHRTSWNQRVTISAEAAPYAYHISHCGSSVTVLLGFWAMKLKNYRIS